MPDSNDSLEGIRKRKEEIFKKIHASGMMGELDFQELEKKGVLTRGEVEFIGVVLKQEMNAEAPSSDPHDRIGQLLTKIQIYQRSLAKDRPVELEELERENVLTRDDLNFLREQSVTYKPHRLRDYHAMDMFHMPTEDGGCVFMGPGGPSLKKRTHSVEGFEKVMEDFLRLPNPDLLMHIEFTQEEGFGLSPNLIMLSFKSETWRTRISKVRETAEELGLVPWDDREHQGSWHLSFQPPSDPAETARAAFALLTQGCGLNGEITYSAGALDVLEENT